MVGLSGSPNMPGVGGVRTASAHGPFFIDSSVANGSVQSRITACAVFTRERALPSSAARSPAVAIYSSIFGSLSRVNEPAPPPTGAGALAGRRRSPRVGRCSPQRGPGLRTAGRRGRGAFGTGRLGLRSARRGAASPPAGGAAWLHRPRWRVAAGCRVVGRRIVAGGAQQFARDRRARGAGLRQLLGHLALGLRALADLLRDARLEQLADPRLDVDRQRLLRTERSGEVQARLGQRPLADLELAELVSEDPQHLVLEVARGLGDQRALDLRP